MKASIDAYDAPVKAAETPRETDAAVLLKAAMILQAVKAEPEGEDFYRALNFNQKIWSAIQAEMTDENPLPDEVKGHLISLSIFIDKQSFKAMAERDPKLLDSIINVNRQIAMGLTEAPADETSDGDTPPQPPQKNIDISE